MDNYIYLFQNNLMLTAFRNSLLRTVLGTVLHVGFTGLAAYGLSKRWIMGRKWYMLYFVITMYFSGGMIPNYLLMKNLGLLNNFLVYIIPSMWDSTMPFSLCPSTIPSRNPWRKAATIDGAGRFQIYLRIVPPASMPIVATIIIFQGVNQWNSWLDTLIYTKSSSLVTLQSIMARMTEKWNTYKNMSEKWVPPPHKSP
ncbi:MAG: carbohydrate ABC transporter permease [Clostridia bacterium]